VAVAAARRPMQVRRSIIILAPDLGMMAYHLMVLNAAIPLLRLYTARGWSSVRWDTTAVRVKDYP
jgi:hypothetical protein